MREAIKSLLVLFFRKERLALPARRYGRKTSVSFTHLWLDVPDVNPGDAAINANAIAALVVLALLGVALPLTVAAGGTGYLAVAWPGSTPGFGSGWRLLRVLAERPVPVWLVAQVGQGGPAPAALLVPVPLVPGCLYGARKG